MAAITAAQRQARDEAYANWSQDRKPSTVIGEHVAFGAGWSAAMAFLDDGAKSCVRPLGIICEVRR